MALRRGFKTDAEWYAQDVRRELGIPETGKLCPWSLARHLEHIVVGVTTRKWRICPTFKNVSGTQVGLTVVVVAFSALRAS